MNSKVDVSGVASSAVPIPRTAVPLGIADPVEKARAELKAALAAIEEKSNVPKRLGFALERGTASARVFARRKPVAAAVGALGVATAVGTVVWGAVRLYLR